MLARIPLPAALRHCAAILVLAALCLAMLAAPGTSTLRDVYSINRGYEDIANRLNTLGAEIETVWE